MSTAETKSITLTDVGPIERLDIEVPYGGGVVEILGRNGCGKSTACDAVDALAGGKPDFSRRDGTDEARVEGFNASLKLTRAAARRGRLDCIAIEGSTDAATLVDPGIKDPEKADFRRIKALLCLTAAQVGEDAFNELSGSEFIDWASVNRTDSVEMAASVKRQLQKAAREEEEAAAKKAGEFDFSKNSAEGLDMEAESDGEKLQAVLEGAISGEAALSAARGAAIAHAKAIADARRSMNESIDSYSGVSAEKAKQEKESANARHDEALKAFWLAESMLADAKEVAEKKSGQLVMKTMALSAAEDHERVIGKLSMVMSESSVVPPDDDALRLATESVTEARQAVEQGALIRDAKTKLAEGLQSRQVGESHAATASELRDSAAACDEVLSNAVNSDVLRVRDGRLVTETGRGTTFFSELSQGERCRIVFDIVVEHARGTSLDGRVMLTMPQEFWEGQDDDNKLHIHELAKERNVLILAPRATSGEIHAEPFSAAN